MLISIITPSYNRAEMIVDAVESVLSQDFQSFEHIIVDGGSTDGTLEILQQYPHLKVIGGADKGMYDALNKGLDIAAGEIIGFLNSDDMYAENVFTAVAENFVDSAVFAVAGRAVVFSESPDGKIEVVDNYFPEYERLMEDSTIGSNFFNAWFFRRSMFNQIGKFNPDYKIVGDRDFMFRFALSNLKYIIIDKLVYKYRMHEDSLTFDKKGEKRAWSADENLAMINIYLVKQGLPELVRKLLIQVQTLETMDMAARSIWTWNYKKFIHYFREGSRHDPSWSLKFFQYTLRRGTVLLLKKGSVKSVQ